MKTLLAQVSCSEYEYNSQFFESTTSAMTLFILRSAQLKKFVLLPARTDALLCACLVLQVGLVGTRRSGGASPERQQAGQSREAPQTKVQFIT